MISSKWTKLIQKKKLLAIIVIYSEQLKKCNKLE